MGASGYYITVNVDDKKKVQERWDGAYEEDAYESGQGAYAGNATTMGKVIARFYDKKFDSENEAIDFLHETHRKWSPPIAVSFKLPIEPGKRWQAKKDKAHNKRNVASDKLKLAQRAIRQAFIDRKSKFVGCKNCGSKLSHEHMTLNMKRFPAGNSIPDCPVCKASLLSNTDQNKLAKLKEKLDKAEEEYRAASRPPVGKKIGWVVGGWAAC